MIVATQKRKITVACAAAALLWKISGSNALRGNTGNKNSQAENTAQTQLALDFNTYRSRIEPIFLKKRQGDVRCYDCHSVMKTRLQLQPFLAGDSAWSEEQSRLNFETVSALVTPLEPMKSRLLLHPLAPEAGGDPTHTGGKFWVSQNDPEWQMLAEWVRNGGKEPKNPAPTPPSDTDIQSFQFYKANIEPIFLKRRADHARCYGCHSEGNRNFHLERLSAGSAAWSEEQSRRNFDNALQQVVAGDPTSSRLLMHPLAPEAGGEAFHSGGRQFATQNDPDFLKIAEWISDLKPQRPAASTASKTRIYITNSAGSTVDVVDPTTNTVVQTIQGIELPHGVAFSPDGSRVYISNESESVLDVVEASSGHVLQEVALSGRPNNLAVTKDGKKVLVGIRSAPGSLDVIDTGSMKRAKNIPVNGGVHNVYVTPDGKYAVAGSLESKTVTVVDLQSEQVAWEVNLGSGVRPMAFETNADGSTNRIFVQLSGFNGFAVVNFAKRAEAGRVKLPDQPGGYGIKEGRMGTPSHGIGVAPDGKSLWIGSTVANAVFEYALPELNLIGHASLPEVHSPNGPPTSSVPEWITFTPDSKFVYVSNSGARSVSAIDVATRKLVAVIPAGEVPKRINTLVMH